MMTKEMKGGLPTSIFTLSLLVALFADIKPVNWIFAYGDGSEAEAGGIMGLLYPAVVLLIALISVVSKMKLKITPKLGFLLIYLILFYVLSSRIVGEPRTRLPLVMAFVIGALIIPAFAKVEVKTFLKALMFFPSFAIFRLDRVFSPIKDWTDAISMDASYAFLIPVIGTIIYMALYWRDENKKTKIATSLLCAINMVFFFEIFLHGSRGSLLGIALTLLFLFVVRKRKNGFGVTYSKGKLGFILIVLLFLWVGFSFFSQLIAGVLSTMGIESHALTKIITLDAEGDISNGRSALNAITISGILEHPVLGNGFDRFDANTGLLYPHNFILQILYDGGLLFFLVIMVPVIGCLIKRMKHCSYDEYAMTTCLLFCSVPGALFSNNLYACSLLWMFFGYLLSPSFVYKS